MKNDLILHFFHARSFPELAGAVRTKAPAVLERWEKVIKEILPSADELTRTQLRDSLPDTLENLAKGLEASHFTPKALLLDSQEHGICRYAQSYNLAELLVEFDILRPILMEETGRHLARELSLGEVIALNMGVDLAARRSILVFVDYQKRELASSANSQAKYLSFMAHDVRGGLNAILLSAEVLRGELEGDPRYHHVVTDVDTIRRNILDTVATMDRFLKAEQLRSGKVKAKREEVDLCRVAHDVVLQFKQQAVQKGLELEADAPDSCIVSTDRELVMQVLQNLVQNAVKYAQSGKVSIHVATRPAPDGATISVADQGPGIPAQRLQQLFTPFVRGETHAGQSGVGLGLFIARQAAEVLGARLEAQSEPGQGTTFTLHLPA
jgi:signal transduction histidine kinase